MPKYVMKLGDKITVLTTDEIKKVMSRKTKSSPTKPKIKPEQFEYEEFFVEGVDLDPPGKWKCWYRSSYKGSDIDYYINLPKVDGTTRGLYLRRDEVLNRDLICHAEGMTCELLSIEKTEEEPPKEALMRLAVQIEKSRAILMNTLPRKILDVYEG